MDVISVVLNNAADVIAERGHGRNTYVSDNGAVCALGAIFVACGATTNPKAPRGERVDFDGVNEYVANEARLRLRKYLYGTGDWNKFSDTIPNWSDRNTTETVMATLRKVAEHTE